MFLMELNEKEKELFWKLAVNLVMADGVISEAEVDLLGQYQKEMGTDFELETEGAPSADELSKEIAACESRIKRVIYFELLGLAYSDNDFAKEEQEMLDVYAKATCISDNDCKKMKECIDEIYEVYFKLAVVINGN